MDFGEAIKKLKDHYRVSRSGWNGKGMFIYLSTFPGYEHYITMYTATGLLQPGWLASQADMLSEDWVVI